MKVKEKGNKIKICLEDRYKILVRGSPTPGAALSKSVNGGVVHWFIGWGTPERKCLGGGNTNLSFTHIKYDVSVRCPVGS